MRTRKWLKKMRESFHLTQKQLSEESGINQMTIESIEQGKRKGSERTWLLIEEYFKNKGNGILHLSIDRDDLIYELKEDIEEFGEDCPCVLIYMMANGNFIFTDYNFIPEEKPFNETEELKDGEYYLITNML